MIRSLIVLMAATIFCSCQNPRIDYQEKIDTTSVVDDRIKDTTKILVAELPVKFDSTDVLLFAVGLVDLKERGGRGKIDFDSYSDSDVGSSYFTNDYLSGNFFNIVFRDKSGNERRLTDKKLKIRNVNFLRDIFKRTKEGWLLYSVFDRDSNGDKELTTSDLEALYISRIDGSDFKKLTKELHEFYDWSLIKGENRLYFRTLEDKNKDGDLDNQDKFHYYYIEFSDNRYSVTEYNPVKIFE